MSGATQPPVVPNEVLLATEERMHQLFGADDVERAPAAPAEPPFALATGTTAKERALNRLKANPPHAVAARLRKMGVELAAPQADVERRIIAPDEAFEEAELNDTNIALGLERIIGRNQLLGVQYLDAGQAAARFVGRILIRAGSARLVPLGTGFLVSPRLLVTNNHVLSAAERARSAVVEFNYQFGVDGKPLDTVQFELDPDTFFVTHSSKELDFTIVAVKAQSSSGAMLRDFGYRTLAELQNEVLEGESVTIIQHPNGEPKQIALRENFVLKLPNQHDRYLYYETDTSPGSSGSPVFNDDWEIVALHHSGFARRDEQNRILARNGKVWHPLMGEDQVDWIANEGIRITAIVRHLRSLELDAARKDLLAAALQGEGSGVTPPPENNSAGRSENSTTGVLRPQSTVNMNAAGSGATATWTIPLQVSISIGQAVLNTEVAASITTITPGGTALPPPIATPADVAAAKAELERARSRAYYSEVQDRADRDIYYESILAESLSPAVFFNRLNELLESTHTTKPGYRPSVHVYPWVDLQPNLQLKSVYSGLEFDPLEFIEQDLVVERLRQEQLQAFLATESAKMASMLEAQLDLLEATLPYNCEHVVPQSWFNKKEPMRGDLHHLFACESGCNSFRGNTPYYDFSLEEEVVRQGCGRREGNRFEPTAGKGAVSRATLYFLLRYPGMINATATEYTRDRIDILIQWHKQDAVDRYERHRNQAIFDKQGNRNPLIDFPEWVDKIDFRQGLG